MLARFIAIAFTVTLVFADESMPGAKKLFYDPTSGVEVGGGSASPARTGGGGRATATTAPAVTGVSYWLELQTPSGQSLRVPSNHLFHNGDRIRLHITSNVDGKLVIMQSQDNSPYELLFPPNESTDNHVTKYRDNVFPRGFFRFDNNPGQLKILLMVTAQNGEGGATPVRTAEARPSPRPDPPAAAAPAARQAVPVRQTAAPATQPAAAPVPAPRRRPVTSGGTSAPASAPSPAPRPAPAATSDPRPVPKPATTPSSTPATSGPNAELRAQYEAEVKANLEALQGSKALVVEDDTTSAEPSTTLVVVAARDKNVRSDVVVAEVRLNQQR